MLFYIVKKIYLLNNKWLSLRLIIISVDIISTVLLQIIYIVFTLFLNI